MRFTNIQMLRAAAALMIVVYHCGIEMPEIEAHAGRVWDWRFDAFGTGVPLFFAISGFIMVTTAREFGSVAAAGDFMRRRIVRIVPLYWAMTAAVLCGVMVAPQFFKVARDDVFYHAASFLFWPAVRLTGEVRPLATPGWTLNLEMMFYAVFALSMLLPRRAGLTATFAVLGGLMLARFAGALSSTPMLFWSDPIIIGFLGGMTVALARESGFALGPRESVMLSVLGGLMLLHPQLAGYAEDDLVPRLASAIPATLVVAGATLGPQLGERSLLARALVLVGNASYSLYLTHEFLLRAMRLAWTKLLGDHLSVWFFLPAALVASTALAIVVYLLFEKPVTRWLNRPRGAEAAKEAYADRVRAVLARP